MLDNRTHNLDDSSEIPVWRGVAVSEEIDSGTWYTDVSHATTDAFNVALPDTTPQLVAGVALRCDLENVNKAEGTVTVTGEVNVTELIALPVSRSTIDLLAQAVAERDEIIGSMRRVAVAA